MKHHWGILGDNEPIIRLRSCDLEEMADIPTDGPGFCHAASFHLDKSHPYPQQMAAPWRKKNETRGLGSVIRVTVAVAPASALCWPVVISDKSGLAYGEQTVGCGLGDCSIDQPLAVQMLLV